MLQPYFSNIEGLKEAGCDEAGRGPLAGPVVAAAVILPPDFYHPLLNDSKKMSHKNRLIVEEYIKHNAISWAIAEVSAQEIDRINILNASFEAMCRAVKMLSQKPDLLLIDGNRFRNSTNIETYHCVVKGDAKLTSIAAASVLAKNYRDRYMTKIAADFPQYGWERNMGYPTKEHRKAILNHGLTPHHRRTFNSTDKQLELF